MTERTPVRCPVPPTIDTGSDIVGIERAWPGKRRLMVAGTDRRGRVRTGSILADSDRQRARMLPHADGPALPGLAAAATAGGTLIAHRAGRRAVLSVPGGYLKIVDSPAAPLVARAADAHRLGTAAGLLVPRVLAAGEQRLISETVPGESAHRLPSHDADAEIGVIDRWVGHAERYRALPAEVLRRARDRAMAGRRSRRTGGGGLPPGSARQATAVRPGRDRAAGLRHVGAGRTGAGSGQPGRARGPAGRSGPVERRCGAGGQRVRHRAGRRTRRTAGSTGRQSASQRSPACLRVRLPAALARAGAPAADPSRE